jgi:hypothetical protein
LGELWQLVLSIVLMLVLEYFDYDYEQEQEHELANRAAQMRYSMMDVKHSMFAA